MAKGSIQELSSLHGKLTRYYNLRVGRKIDEMLLYEELLAEANDPDSDMTDEEREMLKLAGEPMMAPAEATAIGNFLKQNEVTVDVAEDTGLQEMGERLAQLRKGRSRAKLQAVPDVKEG